MQSSFRATVPPPIHRGHRPTRPSALVVLNRPVALDHSLRGNPSGVRLKLVDARLGPSFRGAGSPRSTAHRRLGQNWLPRRTQHRQVSTVMPAGAWPSGPSPCQDQPDQQQTSHLDLPAEMTRKQPHRCFLTR